MEIGKTVGTVLLVGVLFGTLAACDKKEGPMEQTGKSVDNSAARAGEKIDNAAARAGEKIDNAAARAGEKVDNAATKTGEKVEKVGENIQDAAKK